MKGGKAKRGLPVELLPDGALWAVIVNALLNFDPIQVRYVGNILSKIVDVVYAGAEQSGNQVAAIQLLHSVILSLDRSSSTFTKTHYYFIKLCLLTRAYSEALPILDQPIYHIPTAETTKTIDRRLGQFPCSETETSLSYLNTTTGLSGRITTRIYLEYYYMGALCYLAARDWIKAQTFLEIILITPTQHSVASLIMLEAYRKWVLIGLIVKGEPSEPPRAMISTASKHVRILAKPYECVAEAFKNSNVNLLAGEIQEGMDMWESENNYGLIIEVIAAHRRFAILNLRKTYTALSIEDVARFTSPEPDNVQETLTHVQNLITTGFLQAQLTASKSGGLGVLRFLEPSATVQSEDQVQAILTQKTTQLQALLLHISDYDHQIEVHSDYLGWLLKAKKAKDQEKKDGRGNHGNNGYPMGRPPPGGFEDEEMMVDTWQ